ncbi:MAG: hypothetical protein Q9188_006422 [Gyalolechia gomerana]
MDQCKISRSGPVQPPEASIARDSSAAFSSRVGASASALIRESIFRPNPRSIVDGLASSTTSAGKSNTPQISAGPSATCRPPLSPRATLSSPAGLGALNPTHQAFPLHSSPWNRQTVEAQFGSFLAGRQDQSGAEMRDYCTTTTDESSQYSEASAWSLGKAPDTLSTLATSLPKVTTKHRLGDDQADGDAVVALLSDPSFSVDDIPEHQSTSVDLGCSQIVENRPKGCVSQALAYPHRPLGLIPNFLGDPTNPHIDATSRGSISRTNLEDQLTTLPRLAHRDEDFEIEPWIEILARYHDEVWGDMRPYIDAAREEANALRNIDNHRRQNCPAIRRLAMIVGHVSNRLDN